MVKYTNTELRERVIALFASPESRGRELLALALVAESLNVKDSIGVLRAAGRDGNPTRIDAQAIYTRLNAQAAAAPAAR